MAFLAVSTVHIKARKTANLSYVAWRWGKLLIGVDSVENFGYFCSTLQQSSSQVLHADLAAADA